MFKVHVHCIVFVTILYYATYLLVYIDQNQKKYITTCKRYLARQESIIDLYSLRRNLNSCNQMRVKTFLQC